MSVLRRLIPKSKSLTTYQIGLLVARTHKILKERTDEVLATHDITSVDWAILGLLSDNTVDGLRLSDLSVALGVEAPFVTVRINRLEKRRLVTIEKSTDDKRQKFAHISPSGVILVRDIEPVLRGASRSWLKGVTAIDVLGFIRVMQQTIKNNDQE